MKNGYLKEKQIKDKVSGITEPLQTPAENNAWKTNTCSRTKGQGLWWLVEQRAVDCQIR